MTRMNVGTRIGLLLIAAAALLVVVLTAESVDVEGKTWYVDDDGGADYTKIQDAIDAASEWDTIRVFNGTYEENIEVTISMTIKGNGSDDTFIHAQGSEFAVSIAANKVNFTGFSIRDANTGIGIFGPGNRVYENNCSGFNTGIITVWMMFEPPSHNIISDNECYNCSRGISVGGDDNTVSGNDISSCSYVGIHVFSENNLVSGNRCTGVHGHGILLEGGRNNTITGNVVEDNYACGISLEGTQMAFIRENICSNNSGEGIALQYGDEIRDVFIHNNTCFDNQNEGIGVSYASSVTVSNNRCYDNMNGIIISESSDVIVTDNICRDQSNGISIMFDPVNISVMNCTIICNHYGISFEGASGVLIRGCSVQDNEIGICYSDYSENNTVMLCNIHGNTEYGIHASDNNDYTINATNNWWGDASGPYHPVNNTDGKGDNITDYVLFDPWLTEPVNQPPTARAGDNQTVHINEKVRFVGTGKDPDGTIEKYEWDFDGDGSYDWDSESIGETTHSYPLEGTYYAVLRVTDDKGTTATDDCTITVEEEPANKIPTISITSPANNSEVSGTVTIKGSASDGDGDETIEKVEVSVNSGAWETATGTTSWTFEWNTTTLENGEYSLKFRAFDGEDLSEIIEITLNVQKPAPDNQKPTVSISSPTDGEKVSGKGTISGTASDPDGAVERVEVSINGENWTSIAGITSWSFEWDTKELKNGDYTIKVRSYDGTNYSEVKDITVTVENKDDGGGGGGGFIPGFGAAAVVGAVVIYCGYYGRKRKNEG